MQKCGKAEKWAFILKAGPAWIRDLQYKQVSGEKDVLYSCLPKSGGIEGRGSREADAACVRLLGFHQSANSSLHPAGTQGPGWCGPDCKVATKAVEFDKHGPFFRSETLRPAAWT